MGFHVRRDKQRHIITYAVISVSSKACGHAPKNGYLIRVDGRERFEGVGRRCSACEIVNGYAKEVMNKLPMEFAVEAQKLLQISLEGSVG